MVKIANQFGNTATRINTKPLLLIYIDGTLNAAEWQDVLANARNLANSDFYVIGTGADPSMFEVFDALAPWTMAQYGLVNPTYAQAFSWAEGKHAPYINAVSKYPGKAYLLCSGEN